VEGDLKSLQSFCFAITLALTLAGTLGKSSVQAQELTSTRDQNLYLYKTALWQPEDVSLASPEPQQSGTSTDGKSSLPDAPAKSASADPNTAAATNPDEEYGKQPKRILGIIPNFRAVSANAHLAPLSFKEEFKLASQDTFDYSDVIFVGALAGISMATNSQPSFRQGGAGYGRYYWHIFVDGAVENYMTEAIVPAATKEDPRYYTLGKGGFIKRSGYAVSRLFITRTDSGKRTFNLSEIVGAGAAAGIGNAYYPSESNQFVKTYQRWGTQVGLDGIFNTLKEFWPDIDQAVFHGKY
jgi:hypothetical protein